VLLPCECLMETQNDIIYGVGKGIVIDVVVLMLLSTFYNILRSYASPLEDLACTMACFTGK